MNRLRELRRQYRMTQDDIGCRIGVQKAAVCKYEKGQCQLAPDMIVTLCDLFNVSADYLLGRGEAHEAPARQWNEAQGPVQRSILVPVVGRVHAGSPILADENISEYVESTACKNEDEYFYMEVEGDCMIGEHIVEGSRVLVHLQPRVENGQIAVVRIEDEVVLRRVKWIKDQLVLYPSNPKYEPMIVAPGDVQIVGRVVEVRFFV